MSFSIFFVKIIQTGSQEQVAGMRVFSFLTDFRFFRSPRIIFIIVNLHPNAPNVSFFPTIFLGVHPCKVFSVFTPQPKLGSRGIVVIRRAGVATSPLPLSRAQLLSDRGQTW